jgi:hypothetical protein
VLIKSLPRTRALALDGIERALPLTAKLALFQTAINMQKLTVKEAGVIAGVSPALVYQWCQEQRLPHYGFGSEGRRGKILIDPAGIAPRAAL